MDFSETISAGLALLVVAEALLALTGAALLWMALTGRLRAGHHALNPWPVSVEFFFAAAFLIFTGAAGMPYLLQSLPNSILGVSAKDTEWWQIVLTAGYQSGLLLGVGISVAAIHLFDASFKSATTEFTGEPAPIRPIESENHEVPTASATESDAEKSRSSATTGSIALTKHKPTATLHTLGAGLATFAITALLVNSVGGIWKSLLDACGVATQEQEMVDMFRQGGNVTKMVAMIFLAVVMAPITEELIFRAGLFRYLRTRIPRSLSLGIPAVIFALLHGNIVAFLPLAVLSVCFSIAYERTGRIAVPMIAHALFNLHTVLLVMAGVTA